VLTFVHPWILALLPLHSLCGGWFQRDVEREVAVCKSPSFAGVDAAGVSFNSREG
jgi:hypothetical protein